MSTTTNQTNLQELRYPIGTFAPKPFSQEQKEEWIADIRFLPNALEHAILNLSEAQLQTPYRDGGWTLHQVVHHVADSHINAYVRFKLGYTEPVPSIKTYEEGLWAQTKDVEELPVNISITLLFALHERWVTFLQSFSDADWEKTIMHPGLGKEVNLWHMLGMYAWHGRHHTAHITTLKERMGW